jgi:hypothetical protein
MTGHAVFRRRARRLGFGAVVVLALAGMNGPWLYRYGTARYHEYAINRPSYKAENGHWDIVEFPEEYRQDTIHAALLHTGKVLLVAGSGNKQENFDAKRFDTRLWDPVKGSIKKIPTPTDLFCTGHTQLADGRLLIAGGTKRYEKLKGDVTKAGGLMIVHNENPDRPITLPPERCSRGAPTTRRISRRTRCSCPARRRCSTAGPGRSCTTTPGSAASTSRRRTRARSTRPARRTTTGCGG